MIGCFTSVTCIRALTADSRDRCSDLRSGSTHHLEDKEYTFFETYFRDP